MKIKMFTLQAGPGGTRQPGRVYDVPTKEAEELIAGGYAEKVEKVAPAPAAEGGTAPRKATRSGRTAAKADAVDPAAGADSDEGEEPEEEADAAE